MYQKSNIFEFIRNVKNKVSKLMKIISRYFDWKVYYPGHLKASTRKTVYGIFFFQDWQVRLKSVNGTRRW